MAHVTTNFFPWCAGSSKDNSTMATRTSPNHPRISVAAITKQPLKVGQTIKRSIGSFMLRGEAVRIAEHPNHVPIGLLNGATILRTIEKDQMLKWDDIAPKESPAMHAWHQIKNRKKI